MIKHSQEIIQNSSFENECNRLKVTYPQNEIEAFIGKRKRINLLLKSINDLWTMLKDNYLIETEKGVYYPDSEKISKTIEIASIFFDGFIHTTCSLVDCLLHIINKTILENQFSERDVTIEKVKKKLQETKADHVKNKLNEILNSEEYDYFHAYDIVSKHRGIVKTSFSLSMKKGEEI